MTLGLRIGYNRNITLLIKKARKIHGVWGTLVHVFAIFFLLNGQAHMHENLTVPAHNNGLLGFQTDF